MNSEFEALKKIWENSRGVGFGRSARQRQGAYIRLISSQTGFGIDYTRYICKSLLNKGQIAPIKESRDYYKVTSQGKKALKLRGIAKPQKSKKAEEGEKVVYYLPKKLKTKPSKKSSQERKLARPESGAIKADEQSLHLGQTIARAVSFLKESLRQ